MSEPDHASTLKVPRVRTSLIATIDELHHHGEIHVHPSRLLNGGEETGVQIVALQIGGLTVQTHTAEPSDLAVILRDWADQIDRQATEVKQ